tara:strand:- start:56 stop:286 length:231 start_codon:yes stop_codon:yes gene_type:complete
MKGVKYNLTLSKPDDEKIVTNNLTMIEACQCVSDFFKKYYCVDVKVSKHILFNILHDRKPNKTMLIQKCEIHKYTK